MHNRNDHHHDPFYRTPENDEFTENIADIAHQNYDEEIATELADPVDPIEAREHNDGQMNQAFGWVAIALSILSFFFMPYLFGIAGIILGYIARSKHSLILGYGAIVLGVVSILIRLFVIPIM